ncbi:hypothetical protein CS063_03650 [Sporanaerobium hydrogeniformans]|uniref:Uncharacterized protein n=1 Tax=Sporanaerobium hydrogeniformans TaxID=3072179 RepID=A0AC61DFG7_9FIRM|nr:cyclic lactone autoinducer peptide [Sporanaerobium hydrogeniformans]PHV71667.1 hypothetical protein CS063_03650 [Sporanaerobium hydrogeniformans]
MNTWKEKVLKGVVKMADKAVEGASGSKSFWWSYEPQMPEKLKRAKGLK